MSVDSAWGCCKLQPSAEERDLRFQEIMEKLVTWEHWDLLKGREIEKKNFILLLETWRDEHMTFFCSPTSKKWQKCFIFLQAILGKSTSKCVLPPGSSKFQSLFCALARRKEMLFWYRSVQMVLIWASLWTKKSCNPACSSNHICPLTQRCPLPQYTQQSLKKILDKRSHSSIPIFEKRRLQGIRKCLPLTLSSMSLNFSVCEMGRLLEFCEEQKTLPKCFN